MCATYNVHFMNVSISCEKQEKYKKQNLEQGRSYIKMCPNYNSYLDAWDAFNPKVDSA